MSNCINHFKDESLTSVFVVVCLKYFYDCSFPLRTGAYRFACNCGGAWMSHLGKFGGEHKMKRGRK